jgi:hypothetical protein
MVNAYTGTSRAASASFARRRLLTGSVHGRACIDGGLHPIPHGELPKHLLNVLVHGVARNEEPCRDLAIGEPHLYVIQDFELAS